MGPFPANNGDRPYIFICYAHDDAEVVYPLMSWLRQQGVNIWYDEGIIPGELWRSEVAHAIENSSLFLLFVSPNSIVRMDCLREIDYALDRLRPFLAVHIAPSTLTAALRFRIGNVQALDLLDHADEGARRRLATTVRATLLRRHAEDHRRSPTTPARTPDQTASASRIKRTRELIASISRFRHPDSVKETKSWQSTLAAGATVGAFCAALLWVGPIRDLEQQFGLRWLFDLRGPVDPPAEVALIAMNQRAASNISLPRDPEQFHRCANPVVGRTPSDYVALPSMPSRWPRCLHKLLTEKLVEANAQVIAFDVLFRERPPLPGAEGDLNAWQDENLAATLAAAGRVVLAQKLELVNGHETLSEISPPLAGAAVGAAPFPLSIDGGRVDRFPTFEGSAFATPTLPAIALLTYTRNTHRRFTELLVARAGDLADLLAQPGAPSRTGQLAASGLLIHESFRSDPALERSIFDDLQSHDSIDPDTRTQLRALVALYAGNDARLLNFYGPSGTIRAVGYDQVLASTHDELSSLFEGRAVFVGYLEDDQPEQTEHFATAYSSNTKPDLSGVEIAATAFANLLQNATLRETPSPLWPLTTFLSGLLATIACMRLRNRIAVAVIASAAAAYGGAVFYAFANGAIWIPFVVPLCIAVPAAALTSFAWKYRTTRRQRGQLRRAFAYFVPTDVVRMLEQNAEEIGHVKESIECACVATDAANFTPLAESMTSEQLADFLNAYFEALFRGVAAHGGFVSDVVGDAMLAIWPHRSADTHVRLLRALIEMRDAAQQFDEHLAGNKLKTRFGVDWGRVTLTTVGAEPHYEYRAVGDTANTAGRIQELNKKLGTRILLSRPSIGDAAGEFLTRDLGSFLLRGKRHPSQIYELVDRRDNATQEQVTLCAKFDQSMQSLRNTDIPMTLSRLQNIHESFPSDGPTLFYLSILKSGITLENGAVRID